MYREKQRERERYRETQGGLLLREHGPFMQDENIWDNSSVYCNDSTCPTLIHSFPSFYSVRISIHSRNAETHSRAACDGTHRFRRHRYLNSELWPHSTCFFSQRREAGGCSWAFCRGTWWVVEAKEGWKGGGHLSSFCSICSGPSRWLVTWELGAGGERGTLTAWEWRRLAIWYVWCVASPYKRLMHLEYRPYNVAKGTQFAGGGTGTRALAA